MRHATYKYILDIAQGKLNFGTKSFDVLFLEHIGQDHPTEVILVYIHTNFWWRKKKHSKILRIWSRVYHQDCYYQCHMTVDMMKYQVKISFLFLHKTCCGTHFEAPWKHLAEVLLMVIHNMFLWRNKKNITSHSNVYQQCIFSWRNNKKYWYFSVTKAPYL